MSKIRGKDTKPEIAVRRLVFAMGFRFRLHVAKLPGKPDVVLSRHKKVIFIHGCFWHQHSCRKGTLPTTRVEFWTRKLQGNRERDMISNRALRRQGWKVLTVWECELRDPQAVADKISQFLVD